MTITEIAVVVGGLLLGYWLVSVFMPTIFHKSNSGEEASSPEGQGRSEDDHSCSDDSGEHRDSASANSEKMKWFEVLEISENSSREQITAAYKFQISQYHPDKVSRMGLEIRRLAEEKSKSINAAYDEAMSFSS